MTDLEYIKKYYNGPLDDAIKRLESGEPVQYIVGNVDFYGYNFEVNKNVLIPRFETEELVKYTLDIIKDEFNSPKILDIGTGSGCIAVTLKRELPDSVITAVDISNDALSVAKKNACDNNVNINFTNSDIFENVDDKFDVIISNPPYIKTIEEIDPKVEKNEPSIALYAGVDGLACYRKVLSNVSNYLNYKFLIAFEIGETQGNDLLLLANKYLSDVDVEVKKDIYGRDRFVFIKNFE